MLKSQIQEDLKKAMKEGRSGDVSALRMLVAAITNKEKEALRPAQGEGEELAEEVVQEIVAAEMKKRREAAEAFEKGGRPELAEKEGKEAELYLAYLPEQLPEDEVRELVRQAVAETGAAGPQDMGRVMQAVMPKVKGRAEGSVVSRLVRELLS